MRSSSIQLTTIALGVLLAAGCNAPDDDAGTAAAPDIAEPAPAPAPSGTTPEPAPADTAPAASVPARFQGEYAADATAWGGDLRAGNDGDELRVAGWVHRRRDHGGLIFIDLRDRDGLTQLVFDADDTLWENNVLFERVIDASALSELPAGRVERNRDLVVGHARLPQGDEAEFFVEAPLRY